jgi:HNH endonuclease.
VRKQGERSNNKERKNMADFSEAQIQEVWEKATVVENYDPNDYRKDLANTWLQKSQYGQQTPLGWSIDHVYPESKGGDANIVNLRPMHWENNLSKSDDYPSYKTVKTSDGDSNVDKENNYTVNEALQNSLKQIYNIK